jgi:uncharacterized membrane protein YgcG
VRRIEGIASWTEQLRDTLAAAAGLEQAILATAPIAPDPVREQVTGLAARIHQGQRLPDALRAFAAMRLRVAAARARVRTASRIIIAVTVALTAGLLAWSHAFLAPYNSPAGQLVLLAVGGCFAAAFWWLHKIAGFGENPRILTNSGGFTNSEGSSGGNPRVVSPGG